MMFLFSYTKQLKISDCCKQSKLYICDRNIINMKRIFLITAMLIAASFPGRAQKIYSCQYKNEADVKVYTTKYKNEADLIVWRCKYKNEVEGNKGLWHFVKYRNEADKKICFVDYKNEADLVIWFTEYKNEAGWRNKNKKHLLF